MNKLDKLLNTVTMYRLTVYGLLMITGSAFVASSTHFLPYPITSLLGSLGLLLAVGFVAHWLLLHAFASAPSGESWIISVLILFLILKPAQTPSEYMVLAVAVIIASASKYVLAFFNRHIFNPVAIALVILGLLGSGEIYWWVGSKVLLPVVVIVGLLIVHKIRRFHVVLPFLLFTIVSSGIINGNSPTSIDIIRSSIVSGPLIFFATIMLTEPETTLSTRRKRIIGACFVGLMYGVHFNLGPIFSTPALALIFGNIFAYLLSSKRRLHLQLDSIEVVSPGIYELSFTPNRPLKFRAGQYMEWTLPHHHADSRGNRRYFTIASAPTETQIKLAVRVDTMHSSSFKRALVALEPGDYIWASQLGGDFTLPPRSNKKLVFIAGGIGITPFRSMIRQILDTAEQRDITLYYSSVNPEGFTYWHLFNMALKLGLHPNYLITGTTVPQNWFSKTGYLKADTIMAEVTDYKKAFYYLSGPNVMVKSYKKMLLSAGVPSRHVKTDYFPGF